MIKKSITYNNLDGQLRQEDYWFQLTEGDFARKAMTQGGKAYLERIKELAELTEETVAGRGQEIMDTFEMILFDSVGRREGDLFIKDEELTRRFRFSGAYDAFFMELLSMPDSGAAFFKGVFPVNVGAAIDKAIAEAEEKQGVASEAEVTATQPTPFPQSLEKAVEGLKSDAAAQEAKPQPVLEAAPPVLVAAGTDDESEPKWLKEGRYPTSKEMMSMPREELTLAMRMKSDKIFG